MYFMYYESFYSPCVTIFDLYSTIACNNNTINKMVSFINNIYLFTIN